MIQRRFRAAVATLLAVPMLLACGDDTTGPNGDAKETYELVQVNGQALPVVVFEHADDEGSYLATIEDGTLVLTEEHYTLSIGLIVEINGQRITAPADTDSGSFMVSGNTITLTSDGVDEQVVGTISGSRITFATEHEEFGDISFVFEKQ